MVNLKIRTQTFLGFVVVFVVLTINAGIMYTSITSLTTTAVWVVHTQEVIAKLQKLQKLLIDMETGERGFLITGKEKFLEPYNKGNEGFHLTIENLISDVSDNPTQVQGLRVIATLEEKWTQVAASVEIAERRRIVEGAVDADSLQSVLREGLGKSGRSK